MSVFGILSFLLIFVGLIITVVFAIIVYNIATKSYKPQKTYPILLVILFLFVINLFFALVNFSQVIDGVDFKLKNLFE